MTETLLPCPFCGETPTLDDYMTGNGDLMHMVCCVNARCPAEVYSNGQPTETEAIAAWNTRTPPTPTEA